MPTADTNRVAIRYFKEVTYGTVTGNPKFTDIRYTSESLGHDNNAIISNTIRSDRQVDDMIRVDIGASGDLNYEYSMKEYDFLEEAVTGSAAFSSETAQVLVATFPSITFTNTAGALTITRSAGSWITDLGVGSAAALTGVWIEGYGWNAANNIICKVTVGSSATVLNVNALSAFTNQGPTTASASLNFRKLGSISVPGTTITSYAIERQFMDLTNIFDQFYGLVPATHKVNMATGEIITGTTSFLGSTGNFGSATLGDGAPTAAQTTSILNTVDHVVGAAFMLNGFSNSTAVDILRWDMTIKSNARQRKKMGLLGVDSIGLGECEISGSGEFFFTTNPTFYQKGYTFLDAGFSILLKEPVSGFIKVYDFPRIKVSKVRRVSSGKNKDVVIALEWTALRDATEGITARFLRRAT